MTYHEGRTVSTTCNIDADQATTMLVPRPRAISKQMAIILRRIDTRIVPIEDSHSRPM